MRNFVVLFINGQRHDIDGEHAFMMLADFLRQHLGLVGTKIVCAEGDCGACTVLCAKADAKSLEPINACIALVAMLDGAQIFTVEGLKTQGKCSLVQEAMLRCHASQCGYCTPGFVMAISGLTEQKKGALDEQQVKNALTGNLCRCTGYQPIIDAALTLSNKNNEVSLYERYNIAENKKSLQKIIAEPVQVTYQNCQFFAPTTLESAYEIRDKNPALPIVAGATDLGVSINKGRLSLSSFMSLRLISSLSKLSQEDDRLIVGASVKLSQLRQFCADFIPELHRFLNIFASPQIKNEATLVGNIANGSPIADTWPFLLVSDAVVHIKSILGERLIPLSEFYQGYKQNILKANELITHLSFRIPQTKEHLRLFKVSKRKDLDIATINAAFLIELKHKEIKSVKIAIGGVAATALRFLATEKFLMGKTLHATLFKQASSLIQKEIKPLDDLRGSALYRRVLLDGIFERFNEELAGV